MNPTLLLILAGTDPGSVCCPRVIHAQGPRVIHADPVAPKVSLFGL